MLVEIQKVYITPIKMSIILTLILTMMLKSATDVALIILSSFVRCQRQSNVEDVANKDILKNACLENASDLESHKITSNTESPHLNASEDPDNTSPKFMGHI